MSEDVITQFRAALIEDIVFAEGKLKAAINLPVDDYAEGEIYLSRAQAKRQSIRDAEHELSRLNGYLHTCFPSLDYVRGIAEEYIWKRERRRIT
jgi:D-serine dehydratase